jgi:hypothetical protein
LSSSAQFPPIIMPNSRSCRPCRAG